MLLRSAAKTARARAAQQQLMQTPATSDAAVPQIVSPAPSPRCFPVDECLVTPSEPTPMVECEIPASGDTNNVAPRKLIVTVDPEAVATVCTSVRVGIAFRSADSRRPHAVLASSSPAPPPADSNASPIHLAVFALFKLQTNIPSRYAVKPHPFGVVRLDGDEVDVSLLVEVEPDTTSSTMTPGEDAQLLPPSLASAHAAGTDTAARPRARSASRSLASLLQHRSPVVGAVARPPPAATAAVGPHDAESAPRYSERERSSQLFAPSLDRLYYTSGRSSSLLSRRGSDLDDGNFTVTKRVLETQMSFFASNGYLSGTLSNSAVSTATLTAESREQRSSDVSFLSSPPTRASLVSPPPAPPLQDIVRVEARVVPEDVARRLESDAAFLHQLQSSRNAHRELWDALRPSSSAMEANAIRSYVQVVPIQSEPMSQSQYQEMMDIIDDAFHLRTSKEELAVMQTTVVNLELQLKEVTMQHQLQSHQLECERVELLAALGNLESEWCVVNDVANVNEQRHLVLAELASRGEIESAAWASLSGLQQSHWSQDTVSEIHHRATAARRSLMVDVACQGEALCVETDHEDRQAEMAEGAALVVLLMQWITSWTDVAVPLWVALISIAAAWWSLLLRWVVISAV